MTRTPLSAFFLNTSAAAMSAAVIVLSGCASTGAPQVSTMSRYEQLEAQADGVRVYRSPKASNYAHADVRSDDIQFLPTVQITPEQTKEVRATLTAALAGSLSAAGLGNPATGPHLRVRARVTAIDTASPALNAISTVLLLAPVSRGGMTVEIEAYDEATGERVAAMAYAGKAGLKDVTSAYSTLGHVGVEADRAAKRFAALLSGSPEVASVSPATSAR